MVKTGAYIEKIIVWQGGRNDGRQICHFIFQKTECRKSEKRKKADKKQKKWMDIQGKEMSGTLYIEGTEKETGGMRQYGYCRISTGKQNIERQVRNIQASYPEAVIVKETYTGTKFQGRKELEKILAKAEPGDRIIFDSVSRMSRNAEEGYRLYEELFRRDISLVFLKEPHINTETYKKAVKNQISLTGEKVDLILEGVNRYLMELAKEQIRLAFEQAEKEVADLHQRTREGIETARLNGKQIGQARGNTFETKKAKMAKEIIRKHNKSFGGSLTDAETMKQAGVSKKSFYKYKREIRE